MSKQIKNIEVEARSFIAGPQYQNLLKFFKREGKFLGKDYQITYYFSGPNDLRIQKNKNFAKIWLKGGKIHDGYRKEIEVKFNRDDFDKLEELLLTLGYKVKIKWFRTRNDFLWKGIKVSVDYTKGYGYIIELEKMASLKNQDKVYRFLAQKLEDLGIKITPKEEFNEKYAFYQKHWRKILNIKK